MIRKFIRTIRPGLLAAVLLVFSGLLHGETTGPEHGVLYIHGGGSFSAAEFVNLAKEASGKDQPVIRIITTPQGKRRAEDFNRGIPFRLVSTLKENFGLEEVTELYTLSKEEANSPCFL